MAQSGEVSSAPELALVAASHDIVHISASTARRVMHEQGLNAMHMLGSHCSPEKKARVC